MTGKIPKVAAAMVTAGVLLAVAAGTASAEKTVVYNHIPSPLPGNLPSVGFEANQASEFGGQIEFAAGTWKNPIVTVTMSSFACVTGNWNKGDCGTPKGSTFSWPVTVSAYKAEPDNSVGALIARATKTFNMPYRPSADYAKCNGANAGKWFNKADTSCNNGKAFKIKVGLVAKLPAKVIIGVAYNTSDYGAEPQAPQPCNSKPEGCFYDSLNVAVATGAPTVGAAPLLAEEKDYFNTVTAGNYCDAGAAGTGTFRLDSPSAGCWEEYQPAVEVKAIPG
jgi:hypothetical protein